MSEINGFSNGSAPVVTRKGSTPKKSTAKTPVATAAPVVEAPQPEARPIPTIEAYKQAREYLIREKQNATPERCAEIDVEIEKLNMTVDEAVKSDPDRKLTQDESDFVRAFRRGDLLTMLEMLDIEDEATYKWHTPEIRKPPAWAFNALTMDIVALLVKSYIDPAKLNHKDGSWPLGELFENIDHVIRQAFFEDRHEIEDAYLIDLVNWKRINYGRATRLLHYGPYKRYKVEIQPSEDAELDE